MAWIGVITNAGAALLAQWTQGSHTLNITGATIGSGYVEEANMRIATALQHYEDDGSIVRASVEGNVTTFRVQIGPAATTGYTAHEIGLWANLDGGTDVLMALHQDTGSGFDIPDSATYPSFVFSMLLSHALGSGDTLNISIDTSAYVSTSTLSTALNNLAPTYDATATYATGDRVMYQDQLYVCSTTISTPEAFTAAHWTQVDVDTELDNLNSDITDLNSDITDLNSDIYNLDTNIANLRSNIAIVENGETATHYIRSGQFVVWEGALTVATEDIFYGTSLSSSNLAPVSNGGFNALTSHITNLASDIAIVENGMTATNNITSGQFVVWKGHLRRATENISIGTSLNASNLTYVSYGGLNVLNTNIANLSERESITFTVDSTANYTIVFNASYKINGVAYINLRLKATGNNASGAETRIGTFSCRPVIVSHASIGKPINSKLAGGSSIDTIGRLFFNLNESISTDDAIVVTTAFVVG